MAGYLFERDFQLKIDDAEQRFQHESPYDTRIALIDKPGTIIHAPEHFLLILHVVVIFRDAHANRNEKVLNHHELFPPNTQHRVVHSIIDNSYRHVDELFVEITIEFFHDKNT